MVRVVRELCSAGEMATGDGHPRDRVEVCSPSGLRPADRLGDGDLETASPNLVMMSVNLDPVVLFPIVAGDLTCKTHGVLVYTKSLRHTMAAMCFQGRLRPREVDEAARTPLNLARIQPALLCQRTIPWNPPTMPKVDHCSRLSEPTMPAMRPSA